MSLNKFVVCAFLLISSFNIVYGQTVNENKLSGNLCIDAKLTSQISSQTNNIIFFSNEKDEKSPTLAGILSGILPGAGEFYTGQYVKAGIFLAVETAAITTALIYNHKGDYQTAFFESYNNQHWSPVRYAQWTLNNAKYINSTIDPTQYHVFNSNGTLNWSELNRFEDALGGGYSHELATFGTQDYYEITGKYPQFSHGWDTSNQSDTDFHILTNQFLWYAHQRGLANSLYKTASFAVGTLYVNHFLSILDAVWSAHSYNSKITMNMRVQDINVAGNENICPTLNINYYF
jgi:TM2 domain-containing membrane protein YozV